MGKLWVCHEQYVRDPATQVIGPRDLSGALAGGLEPVVVFQDADFALKDYERPARLEALGAFDHDEDVLLLTGHPVLMAECSAVVTSGGKRANVRYHEARLKRFVSDVIGSTISI